MATHVSEIVADLILPLPQPFECEKFNAKTVFRELFSKSDIGKFVEQNQIAYYVPFSAFIDLTVANNCYVARAVEGLIRFKASEEQEFLLRLAGDVLTFYDH